MRCGLRGNDNLPSVPGICNSGRLMDRQCYVVLSGRLGFSRMHTHSDADSCVLRPVVLVNSSLNSTGGLNSLACFLEGEKAAVAFSLDLHSSMRRSRLMDQAPMLNQEALITFAKARKKLCRSFDVSEAETHCAGRKCLHIGLQRKCRDGIRKSRITTSSACPRWKSFLAGLKGTRPEAS